jgi:site-specific recombinase XerD
MKNSSTSKSIINYATEFLDYLEIEKGLSTNTQENYSRYLSRFFNWLKEGKLDSLKPHSLNEDHIWEYRVYLSKTKLSKASQNAYLIALRSMLEFFENRKIKSLYSSKIKLAKKRGVQEIKTLSMKDLKKILEIPSTRSKIGLRDRAIMETFFSTGIRIAELVSLNREQIKVSDSSDTLEISITGKGNRVRPVYFSARSLKWLKKYINIRDDIDTALFINYKPGAEKSNNERRLTIGSIQAIIKKYFKLASISTKVTPHTFRHTFATDLLNQGVDIRLVQEFLGHKSVSTTQVYTHITNKQLKSTHKKLHSGNIMKN